MRDSGLLYRVETKLQFGPGTILFNKRLLDIAVKNTFDWIWIDKNVFAFPGTIRKLADRGLFLVHHMTDDLLNPDQPLRHYRKAIPLIHVHLTSNIYNVQELINLGAPHAVQTHLGFDPELCRPGGQAPVQREEFRSDVVFIGHWRKHIDDFVLPAIKAGIDVKIWGDGWKKSPNKLFYVKNALFRSVSDKDYASILASAKIALCFLSHANRNTSTGRSFEIPAVGTFMLAERTEEHLSFYKEGEEAEFFSKPNEFMTKLNLYLKNHEERQQIALAGHRRAMTSGYTYFDRVSSDMKSVLPIFEKYCAQY
ncbi:CgeB family protein [Desulfomonile tiedjei]|nr:glycosyltransferase [Desulfomonile tiedjei]